MQGVTELFTKSRAFLASKGFAKNVRLLDVIAVTENALTGNIGLGLQKGTYSGGGSFAGPLDASGNMPTSSAGLIIGSALVMPNKWVAASEPAIEQAYQAIAQDTSHVVNVAGTDVLVPHATFEAVYPSVGGTGVTAGPLYGINDASRKQEREPAPMLWVGPGERVTQGLLVRREIALGAVTTTPELVVLIVTADKGED